MSLFGERLSEDWAPGFDERCDALSTGTATYKPEGCRRYTGAPLPPHGTPTPINSLENIDERLIRLAFGKRDMGANAPPLDTYRTETQENGVVYKATDAYIAWFHACYPRAGGRDQRERPLPSSPSEGVRGAEAGGGTLEPLTL